MGLKKLDRTEKVIIISWIILLLLDAFSTVRFVLNGWGDGEANIFIVNFGWYWGVLLSLIANAVTLWFIVLLVQKNRSKPDSRFLTINALMTFLFIRVIIIINNFVIGSKVAEDFVKPTYLEILFFYEVLAIIVTVLFFFGFFVYLFFKLNYTMKYDGVRKGRGKT